MSIDKGYFWEKDNYLHDLYNHCNIEDPLSTEFEVLSQWVDLIDPRDSRFTDNTITTLINHIPLDKPVLRDKMKDLIAIRKLYTKRDFNRYWSKREKQLGFSGEKESSKLTVKEGTDLIVKEVKQNFDVITLSESLRIMIFQSNSNTFNIDPLLTYMNKKIGELSLGSYKTIKNNILENIRDSTKFEESGFCRDSWVINYPNGLYDVIEDKFYVKGSEETKDKKFFYEIPHDYIEGDFKCKEFRKALDSWLRERRLVSYEGKKELLWKTSRIKKSDIFEMIGLCLTLNTGLKKAFISHGKTNTGKTQFSNILGILFDSRSKSSIPLQRLTKDHFGTLGLQYKVINICDDLPQKKILNLGTFKNITGGGATARAEVKGGDGFDFIPSNKFWFNANIMPDMENVNDEAFFGRWIIIPFKNQFHNNNGRFELDYYKTITEDSNEIQGIIHESIKGLRRLYKRKAFREEVIENTRHIWLYDSDPVYTFIYDNCLRTKGKKILSEEFFERFNENTYMISYTKQKLTLELQKFKIYKKQRRNENGTRKEYYIDLEWKPILEELELIDDFEDDIDSRLGIKDKDLTDFNQELPEITITAKEYEEKEDYSISGEEALPLEELPKFEEKPKETPIEVKKEPIKKPSLSKLETTIYRSAKIILDMKSNYMYYLTLKASLLEKGYRDNDILNIIDNKTLFIKNEREGVISYNEEIEGIG